MAAKPAPDKTKKYSGVVKSVKKTQAPEEPKITADQVVAAFKSFGFEPNQNNQNDIGYWTTRPQSEGAKLMEELRNRRIEINEREEEGKRAEEEGNKAKKALPRLSDEDIVALFDEYGLPAPDPEWARNYLPNDPQKIRSILEMQRKMADEMLKKELKNTVNTIPEQPKAMAGMPMTPAQPMRMDGSGGPGPLAGQETMMGPAPKANPFFIGDHSIVRIANPSNPNAHTTWLVDAKRKVLRPFMSEQAFRNAFEDPDAAERSVVMLSSKELGPGGALEGFKPLQAKQGINDDGSMKNIDFSPAQIQRRYGKQSDPVAENRALSMLDGVFTKMGKPQGGQGLM